MIGDGSSTPPTITAESPPREQLEMLAVLRRTQTDADRGAASVEALRLVGSNAVKGVRTDSIRLLTESPNDRGIVLVPVARYARTPLPLPPDLPKEARDRLNPPPIRDALCLYQLDRADGAGVACWSSDDVREGRAWLGLGTREAWLVADGVAKVVSNYPDGTTLAAPVRSNLAVIERPRAVGVPTTTFLDGAGNPVRTIPPSRG